MAILVLAASAQICWQAEARSRRDISKGNLEVCPGLGDARGRITDTRSSYRKEQMLYSSIHLSVRKRERERERRTHTAMSYIEEEQLRRNG